MSRSDSMTSYHWFNRKTSDSQRHRKNWPKNSPGTLPIPSMGLVYLPTFSYIFQKMVNVGKYTIHGWYGLYKNMHIYLVGGWTNPFEKNMRKSNWIMKPQENRGENSKNIWETPPPKLFITLYLEVKSTSTFSPLKSGWANHVSQRNFRSGKQKSFLGSGWTTNPSEKLCGVVKLDHATNPKGSFGENSQLVGGFNPLEKY